MPKGRLAAKFVYFYRPYNFEINTHAHMRFDEGYDSEKESKLRELLSQEKYLSSLDANLDQWGERTNHGRQDFKE